MGYVVDEAEWAVRADRADVAEMALCQRPKKSELSGWQLPTRKNFPGGVRKSFSRQKKTRKSFSRQKKRA